MAGTAPRRQPNRYLEAVLLGLVAHELVAGWVFWLVGMPGIGDALWAIGTGLTIGYVTVSLVRAFARPREDRDLVMITAPLVVTAVIAAFGWYAVSNALGIVALAVALWAGRPIGTAAVESSRRLARR